MTPRRPPDEVEGGHREETAFKESDATADNQSPQSSTIPHVADQIRQRRAASRRLVPLAYTNVRDPFDLLATPPGPSDFGLCRTELQTEVDRCLEIGWNDWEIVTRFTDPKQAAA